ncbi:MAG: hypothetical protein SNJ59_09875 [Aggregatilineales bacterium]
MNTREPDWKTLADVHFVMQRRMLEYLNAAVGALTLTDTPEGAAKPDNFWKERALRQVMRAHNLFNAWNALVRHKTGQRPAPSAMRQFSAADVIDWLALELRHSSSERSGNDRLLHGNRETLQEALLLLHSAAHSIGPGVRTITTQRPAGMWFRVRYTTYKAPPPTLAALREQLANDWRTEMAAYELERAQDFLELNGLALEYLIGDGYCELGFFVRAVLPGPLSSSTALRNDDSRTALAPGETSAGDSTILDAREVDDPTGLDDLRRSLRS